jgi:hypothetical protein
MQPGEAGSLVGGRALDLRAERSKVADDRFHGRLVSPHDGVAGAHRDTCMTAGLEGCVEGDGHRIDVVVLELEGDAAERLGRRQEEIKVLDFELGKRVEPASYLDLIGVRGRAPWRAGSGSSPVP